MKSLTLGLMLLLAALAPGTTCVSAAQAVSPGVVVEITSPLPGIYQFALQRATGSPLVASWDNKSTTRIHLELYVQGQFLASGVIAPGGDFLYRFEQAASVTFVIRESGQNATIQV